MSADEPAPPPPAPPPPAPAPQSPAPSPATPRPLADPRARITGVIVVAMSLVVWWPAFVLGAWGDFFFDQMLTVWVASTAALIVVLIQSRGRQRVARGLALAVPSLWLVLSFLEVPSDSDTLTLVVTVLAFLVGFLALPTTIWVLVRIIWPEFGEDIPWRRRILVIVTVTVIAVASYVLGLNQSHFLTCEEFTVSGNSEPPGCTPAESVE